MRHCEQTLGPQKRPRRCRRLARINGLCREHARIEERLHRAWLAEAEAAARRGLRSHVGVEIRTRQPLVVSL